MRIVVPSDVCVKSGVRTGYRVTLRGSTTPSWVMFLLLFTVIGWLIAVRMTSSRYQVVVPFRQDLYERWFKINFFAWLLGIAGVVIAVAAGLAGFERAAIFLSLTGVALVGGLVNSWKNTVAVVLSGEELLLTRVSRAFAASLTHAPV